MPFKLSYSFEGNYRTRPEQNLSGASRKYSRDVLLQKAHEERQKRQVRRNQALNSGFTPAKGSIWFWLLCLYLQGLFMQLLSNRLSVFTLSCVCLYFHVVCLGISKLYNCPTFHYSRIGFSVRTAEINVSFFVPVTAFSMGVLLNHLGFFHSNCSIYSPVLHLFQ